MDDVGPIPPQGLLDPPVTDRIAPGMDGAPQRGNDFHRHPPCPCPLEEASFRPQWRPSDQEDVVAVDAQQILAGQERIFLSPAKDQPGDDVGNSHGGWG